MLIMVLLYVVKNGCFVWEVVPSLLRDEFRPLCVVAPRLSPETPIDIDEVF